jgi:steroid delta-isomerase-like uncharacterized protein
VSTEENKDLNRRFSEEVLNTGNVAAIDAFVAPDVTIHMPGQPSVRGREAFKQLAAAYFTAFPDFHETTEDEIAAGDKVARRVTWRGTHRGELMGLPPTGREVTVSGMRIFHIADDKIAEEWAVDDALGMMQQLGMIPVPEQPARQPRASPPSWHTHGDRPTSAEENTALIRRLNEEFWNAGKAAVFDEVFAPDYVDHSPAPGQAPDREGFRQVAAALRAALPDLSSTIEDLVAEADKVAWRWSLRATHRGPLLGIPATGKPITLTGITINRIADGQIVERWSQVDNLGLLQQLGVIPAPGQPGA